jgi:hypothetical protein
MTGRFRLDRPAVRRIVRTGGGRAGTAGEGRAAAMKTAKTAERSAWASAKIALLNYWDHPPAALFWLLGTAGTIGVLKAIGL